MTRAAGTSKGSQGRCGIACVSSPAPRDVGKCYPDGRVEDIGNAELRVKCPCGQWVTVFERGLLHKEPRCVDFVDREALAYLTWVREHHEAQVHS